jgi:hypothetical protein
MNKKEELLAENNLKSLVKKRCLSRRNCCKYWKGVTSEHFIVMCEICCKLARNGYDFWTEVEGVNDKWRADIVAINGSVGQIIEILHTESEAKFSKKSETYPEEFILRGVRTKGFNIDEFDI